MDISSIRTKVRGGAGKAAAKLGSACSIYRPTTAEAAIAAGNLVATQPAAFATDPRFSFARPTSFGNRAFYVLTDADALAVGDYLVAEGLTYFVATRDDIAPPMAVRCDRTLTIKRPQSGTPGSDYYGSDTTTSEETILAGWPAALTESAKSDGTLSKLPGDVKTPWVKVLLPAGPVQIAFADVMYDDLATPSRYIVSGVLYSPLGCEITASQAQI